MVTRASAESAPEKNSPGQAAYEAFQATRWPHDTCAGWTHPATKKVRPAWEAAAKAAIATVDDWDHYHQAVMGERDEARDHLAAATAGQATLRRERDEAHARLVEAEQQFAGHERTLSAYRNEFTRLSATPSAVYLNAIATLSAALRDIRDSCDTGTAAHDMAHKALDDVDHLRPQAPRHNHLTRDIKQPGQCPACDAHHSGTPAPEQAATDLRPREGEPGWHDVTCGACGEEFGTNFTAEEIECPECEARRCPHCRAWFGSQDEH